LSKEILMSTISSALPLEVDHQSGRPAILRVDADGPATTWAAEYRDRLRATINLHGSVLVRGLHLNDVTEVGSVVRALAPDVVTDLEAFAAREEHADGLYSSSTWPAKQQMCMHHELSYRLDVPGLMMFACLVPPDEGGAIPVADSAAVLDALPRDLVERFEREGWMLARSYTEDFGLSVAEAFGTDDRADVERYCRDNRIELEWQDDGDLRTRQRRNAVVQHPVNGRRCWFNQIAFLSEWTMKSEVREFMVDMYGDDGLPFNTRFGNGDPIGEDVVQVINDTYDANTVSEPLQSGDLLLVDNIGTAHSREPYEGPREVVVAMADSVRVGDFT
jgi:alpha-ketoglutarate-dependent taurine dioxygenase